MRAPLMAVAFAWAAASCGASKVEAPVELLALADRVPAVDSMLTEAQAFPPERIDGLLRVSAFAGDSPSSMPTQSRWNARPAQLSIDVEGGKGDLDVHGDRAHLKVHRTQSVDGASAVGSTIVLREGARIRSILLARPESVEELVVSTGVEDKVGYDLELPTAWSLQAPAGFRGLVEVRDAHDRARLRFIARVAWDAQGKAWPLEVRAAGSHIEVTLPESATFPIWIDPEWKDTSTPALVRSRATATVLSTGQVLLLGGQSGGGDVECTSEIYDTLDGSWRAGPALKAPDEDKCTPVMDATAVPLPDGSVLIAGGANRETLLGANQPAALDRAWRYDPVRQVFTSSGAMTTARVHHTATLLRSGKVLIAGGSDRQAPLEEDAFQCPPVMGPNGDMVSCNRCVGMASAELYDPASGTFSAIPMPTARSCHTATLLADDSVLLLGGGGSDVKQVILVNWGTPLASMSLYKDGAFTEPTEKLTVPRLGHVAVLRPDKNQILVALGRDEHFMIGPPHAQSNAEVIDVGPPMTVTPLPACAAKAGTGLPVCPTERSYVAGVLTRDGKALLAGGQETPQSGTQPSEVVNVFDFDTRTFEPTCSSTSGEPCAPQLTSPARKPVLASLPNGKILLVGETAPPFLFDTDRWSYLEKGRKMLEARSAETVTPLPDGTFLIAGGQHFDSTLKQLVALDTAEIFDPSHRAPNRAIGSMSTLRSGHSATLLPPTKTAGARVLIVGGQSGLNANGVPLSTASADLYDLSTGKFVPTGSMEHARSYHTATRLPTGEVLVIGGITSSAAGDIEINESSTELYHPDTGEFTPLPPPLTSRAVHSATLLPSGNVLISGGFTSHTGGASTGPLAVTEVFDYKTRTYRALGNLAIARGTPSVSLVLGGKVLIAGGSSVSNSAELFDEETGTSRFTRGEMPHIWLDGKPLLLPSGKVLIAGGSKSDYSFDAAAVLDDSVIYDPLTETFEQLCPTQGCGSGLQRERQGMALLPNGSVALFGGASGASETIVTDEISSLSLPPDAALLGPPHLGAANPLATPEPGSAIPLSGSDLTTFWETSSGPYPSSAGFPIALWVPSNGSPSLGALTHWSPTGADWSPVASTFAGPGYLFVARAGKLSEAVSVEVGLAKQGTACDSDAACVTGFCSDGVCCDVRCHVAGDAAGLCQACSVAQGAEVDGTCSLSKPNTDPHADCTDIRQCAAGTATCDGAGQCKPCRCNSAADCPAGYGCTADGSCEIVPEAAPPACTVVEAPPPAQRFPWSVLGGVAALAWLRRTKTRRRGARRA